MTKPRHVLSWQKVRERGETDGMKMGEREPVRQGFAGYVRIWKQWEITE